MGRVKSAIELLFKSVNNILSAEKHQSLQMLRTDARNLAFLMQAPRLLVAV